MATIPSVRIKNDVKMKLSLSDSGVLISWDTVTIQQICLYSVKQKTYAGSCTWEIDEDDATILHCLYRAEDQYYLGNYRILVSVVRDDESHSYETLAFNMIGLDEEVTDETVDDDDLSVVIKVEVVDTSVLTAIIAACVAATTAANSAATSASTAATSANEAASSASETDTEVQTAEAARVSAESARVEAETARESQASSDHSQAASDHTTATTDHATAESDHTTAASDHTTAEADHTQAVQDKLDLDEIDEKVDDLAQNIGDLSDLETDDKSSLVAAINEVAESDGKAVKYTEQSLTDEQQAQARTNINAADADTTEENFEAIKENMDNLGDAHAKSLTMDEIPMICGDKMIVIGTSAPSVAPDFIGQMYIDKTNGKVYVATANTSASGFKVLN